MVEFNLNQRPENQGHEWWHGEGVIPGLILESKDLRTRNSDVQRQGKKQVLTQKEREKEKERINSFFVVVLFGPSMGLG